MQVNLSACQVNRAYFQALTSARKHGIREQDIRHAFRNVIEVRRHTKDGLVYVGPAQNGALLELAIVEIDDDWSIVHAMRLRKGFVKKNA